jgi:quinol monooxygenase YgiN
MVHASIRMEMSSGNARAALDVLGPLAERTRVEPGCFSCRVYRDVQQEDTIMIEELWSGQEKLRRHLCSSEYQRVLLVVEMAKGQPEIRFSTISHSSGFETIAEARSRAGSTHGAV